MENSSDLAHYFLGPIQCIFYFLIFTIKFYFIFPLRGHDPVLSPWATFLQDSLYAVTLEITVTVNELLLDWPPVQVLQEEHKRLLVAWCDYLEPD